MTGRRIPRPRKPGLPVAGTVTAVLLWGVVAHDSGVGWVQATGTLVAGFLLVGLVAPALAVSRAHCRVASVPSGAVAGQPVTLEVSTSAALEVSRDGIRAVSGRDHHCRLTVVPPHRGQAADVAVTVASAAPFGLLWWERTVVLRLPRPLDVAPRTAGPLGSAATDLAEGDTTTDAPSVAGLEPRQQPRGVRPYSPGDRFHQVHWPATAHLASGTLMVRETEQPSGRPRTLAVELPDDPDAAELAAERVMGTVAGMLGAGDVVDLMTVETAGPVRGPVTSLVEAGRRLARCAPATSPWRA